MRWLWAAYKAGCPDFGFPNGMDPKEFEQAILDTIGNWAKGWMLMAPLYGEITSDQGGIQPVGIVAAGITEHRMEPHVIWFPWASPRNRLEAAVAFLNEMRKTWQVVIFARPENAGPKGLFTVLCKYAVLRPVGTFYRWFGDGEKAMIYQTKEFT